MSQIIENQTIEAFLDRNTGCCFCDLEFIKCKFLGCNISLGPIRRFNNTCLIAPLTREPGERLFEPPQQPDPKIRSVVRNVKLLRCEEEGSSIGTAIIEDTVVDGLLTSGLFQTFGAVFKHVILKGKIGRIMISRYLPDVTGTQEQQLAEQRFFDGANEKYYSIVDWALDISQAEFVECDIRNIPSRLIRRDPDTQVVITRKKALEGNWRHLDLSKTYWGAYFEGIITEQIQDCVLVAPKRGAKFRQLLDGLNLLRREGIAEPD